MHITSSTVGRSVESAYVVTASGISYAVTLAIHVAVARLLDPVDFGAYSAAVAMSLVICTCATLGLEKYALRVMPEYLRNNSIAKVRGYILFGAALTVICGTALGFFGIAAYEQWGPHTKGIAVLEQMLWYVPAIALFLFLLEIATIFGAAAAATTIYRLVQPMLVVIGIVPNIMGGFTVEEAVTIYGGSWVVSLAILAVYLAVSLPKVMYSRRMTVHPRLWVANGMGYLGLSLLMMLFWQSAILVLEILKGDRTGVALLSASLQIAGLAVIIQTATMRIFAPELARRIAANDLQGQQQLLRRRALFMLVLGGCFLLLVLQFGREFLGLFGKSYVEAYPTLVLLTIGNVVSIVFGSGSVFLQFHGRHRLALALAAGGTVLAFTAISVAANFGGYATVAQTYTVAIILFSLVMAIAARLVARSLAQS